MAMSKLTLTATPEIISLAEEQARYENTSISAMFANFILAKAKLASRRKESERIGPLTKSLTGIVQLPSNFDEKEFMCETFAEKYGLDQ
ncbi:MAG: hypothetical protein J6333_04700 [Planctomycetes bacterium]|nr:hypothetical protein [Planctomycetota bacterium]